MSMSSIYFLDMKGNVLIARNYRSETSYDEIDKFMPLLVESEEEGHSTPILHSKNCTFCYIRHKNVYIVTTTTRNANMALIFVFLYKMVDIMVSYFKNLEEESVHDNFVTIYELLDELVDFGYPQITNSEILKKYITQEGSKLEVQTKVPASVTSAVSWRPEGIVYKKNEVFINVIESVNALVNANGSVINCEVTGVIKVKSSLSGMPLFRIGLNNSCLFGYTKNGIFLEDVKFHHCVSLLKYEKHKLISFIPPDGSFDLMNYRVSTGIKPLIFIEPIIRRQAYSNIEYTIKVSARFCPRATAGEVEICIPVPLDVDSPKFKTTYGRLKYVPEESVMKWMIKSLAGGKEYLMNAIFRLPSVEAEEETGKPPIRVKFRVPFYTMTGIQIIYVRVMERSDYHVVPCVNYLMQSGNYEFRTH